MIYEFELFISLAQLFVEVSCDVKELGTKLSNLHCLSVLYSTRTTVTFESPLSMAKIVILFVLR